MGNVVRVSNGLKTYDIADQDDNILGSFSFNPSDTGIVKRYNAAIEKFRTVFEEIKGMDNPDAVEVLEKLDEKAYELIDGIFNASIAKNFFSIMGPFSPLENGNFFIEDVIDAIGQAFEAETGERVKKVNSKIQKHTKKYHG